MMEKLKALEKHHGRENVPTILGISDRQYRRIRINGNSTDTIKILVGELILKIQELEKQERPN